MKSRTMPRASGWICTVLAALTVLLCLAGAAAYGMQSAALVDVQNTQRLEALIAQETGAGSVSVAEEQTKGNLYAVSYQADGQWGLALLERADGLLSSGYRLLDCVQGSDGLNVYQTSLHGVVDLTVFYGENTGSTVALTGSAATVDLPEGQVLELVLEYGQTRMAQQM